MKFSQITCILLTTLMIVPGKGSQSPDPRAWKQAGEFVYQHLPCKIKYLEDDRVIKKHEDDDRIHKKGEAYLSSQAFALKRKTVGKRMDYRYTIQFLNARHYRNGDTETVIDSYNYTIRCDKASSSEKLINKRWDIAAKDIGAQRDGVYYYDSVLCQFNSWILTGHHRGLEKARWTYKGPHPQGQELLSADEGVELYFPTKPTFSNKDVCISTQLRKGEVDEFITIMNEPDQRFSTGVKKIKKWVDGKIDKFEDDGELSLWYHVNTKPRAQAWRDLRSEQEQVSYKTNDAIDGDDKISEAGSEPEEWSYDTSKLPSDSFELLKWMLSGGCSDGDDAKIQVEPQTPLVLDPAEASDSDSKYPLSYTFDEQIKDTQKFPNDNVDYTWTW